MTAEIKEAKPLKRLYQESSLKLKEAVENLRILEESEVLQKARSQVYIWDAKVSEYQRLLVDEDGECFLKYYKCESLINFRFPEIDKSVPELVILSNEERRKICSSIKDWTPFENALSNHYSIRDMKAYLLGSSKFCFALE